MPPADNRHVLAAATQRRSRRARTRAREAITRLDRDGTPITFAAVAEAADVSRSLLYRDPDLRSEIERLRAQQTPSSRTPVAQQTSPDSLHRRLEALLDDNADLRDENAKLRQQLALLLGQQRTTITPATPRPQIIGPCS